MFRYTDFIRGMRASFLMIQNNLSVYMIYTMYLFNKEIKNGNVFPIDEGMKMAAEAYMCMNYI